MLAAVLPEMTSVHTVVAVGEGDVAPLTTSSKTAIRYDDLLDGQSIEFDRPDLDEEVPPQCVTPAARRETRRTIVGKFDKKLIRS